MFFKFSSFGKIKIPALVSSQAVNPIQRWVGGSFNVFILCTQIAIIMKRNNVNKSPEFSLSDSMTLMTLFTVLSLSELSTPAKLVCVWCLRWYLYTMYSPLCLLEYLPQPPFPFDLSYLILLFALQSIWSVALSLLSKFLHFASVALYQYFSISFYLAQFWPH